MFFSESREQRIDRAINNRRLSRLASEFRERATKLQRYLLFEEGICVFERLAHSEDEFVQMYREHCHVTADGNWYVQCVG